MFSGLYGHSVKKPKTKEIINKEMKVIMRITP